MIRVLLRRTGILVFAASLLVPAVLAQAPQQAQETAPEVDVSDEEVTRVAELLVDIDEVQREYQDRLRHVNDADDARSLQQEMKEAINQTIESFDGLATDRYDEIVRAAQADDELKQRILAQVEDERAERQARGD